MKRYSAFSIILVIIFCFNNIQSLAQNRAKVKEVIVIQFLIPNRTSFSEWKVPINRYKRTGSGVGGISISECGFPETEECKNFVYSSYEFSAHSIKLNNFATRVSFNINVSDECKTKKVFTVYRAKKIRLKLRCGVILTSRYGLASEKEEVD